MVPIIGITSSYDEESGKATLARYYIQAVEAAGGLPLVLPCILSEAAADPLLRSIDGLLLSGGVDVDPLLFGEEPQPALGEICPARDRFELALTRRALQLDIPILAICRGIQVMNIAAGGTVIQDISTTITTPIKHDQKAPRWYGTHTINVSPASQLASVWGERIIVNSMHHQAVGTVAEGFVATAWTSDGVVEAIESSNHRFALGVQCHPECMWQEQKRIFNLFIKFVEAAKASK